MEEERIGIGRVIASPAFRVGNAQLMVEVGPEELEYVFCHYFWQSHLRSLPSNGLFAEYLHMRCRLRPFHLFLRDADQRDLHKREGARQRRTHENNPHFLDK